ncbi:hypothetical protein [Sporosarcina sp. NPDC096371]|uniref:hypothetical protein n=1 Tax=Sporosarcina sp. NPDC096371 TaxID=3364530 RepID=UPI003807A4B1
MRKWVILIIVIVLGGAMFITWLEERNLKVTGNTLNSIPDIDSIVVKDGKTKEEEVLTLTNAGTSFSPSMAEIYELPIIDLKWSERKLLKGEPILLVEYLTNNEVRFSVGIYELKDEHKAILSNYNPSGIRSYSYSYSPKEKNTTYIFAIKENYQLLGVNEGMKELLNIVSSKMDTSDSLDLIEL